MRLRMLVIAAGLAACGPPPVPSVPSGKLEAISLGAATPSRTPATRFVKKPLAVGDRVERTSTMTFAMAIAVTMTGQAPYKSENATTETMSYVAEVLETKSGAPSKMKVTFDKAESTQTYGSNVIPRANQLAGKSFVVENDRYGNVEVKTPDGKQPDYSDLYEAKRRFEGFGKADPLFEALPSKPIERGTVLEVSPTLLAQYFSETQQHGLQVTDSRVVFRDEADGEGIFDITLTVSQNAGAMGFAMEVRGEARVAIATSQTTALTLDGPLKIETPPQYAQQMNYEGSGNFSLAVHRHVL